MNWVKVDNSVRIQHKGVYSDWKQQISDDCYNRCVYCSILEGEWGGIDHYHIDHFRPKSKFSHLENVIVNLYLSCPICNKFKGDDWPNEPINLNKICYPDPAVHHYHGLFIIDPDSFTLSGKYVASKYVITRLYLNRPQLILSRREHFLSRRSDKLFNLIDQKVRIYQDFDILMKFSEIQTSINSLLIKRNYITPYKLEDIRKPKE